MGPLIAATILSTLPSHEVVLTKGDKTIRHKVFITIDDHPTPHTDTFLRVLKKCKLKVTFFVWGFPERFYRLNSKYGPNVRQHNRYLAIHKAGHVIGNHSVTHRDLCTLTPKKIKWELKTVQRYLWRMLKYRPKYWRAPALSRCRKTWRVARRLKLTHVSAHIDDIRHSAKWMWWKLRQRIRRKKPSTILLFHNNVRKFKAFLKLSSLCTNP